MEPSVLHSQIRAFEERNTLLHFGLGLVAFSRCLLRDPAAEQDERVRARSALVVDESSTASAADRFIYFTLGLVACSGRILRDLADEQDSAVQPREGQDSNESLVVRVDDLRDLLI